MTRLTANPLHIIQGKINKVTAAINWNRSRLDIYFDVWSRHWPVLGFIFYQYFIQQITGASWAGVIGDILVHILCIALAVWCEDVEDKDRVVTLLYPLGLGAMCGSFFYPLIYHRSQGWVHVIYLSIFLFQLALASGITFYRCHKHRMLKKELKRLLEEEQECLMWINFLRENKEKK